MEHDIVKVLMNPEDFYPGNFGTVKLANAMLSCLCQEAADEITRLRQQVDTLTEQRDLAVEALKKAAVAFWELHDADIHAKMTEEAITAIQSAEVTK